MNCFHHKLVLISVLVLFFEKVVSWLQNNTADYGIDFPYPSQFPLSTSIDLPSHKQP